MRGLEKKCTQWRKQTHGHGNSMTNSALWGRVGEKKEKNGFTTFLLPGIAENLASTFQNIVPSLFEAIFIHFIVELAVFQC